jgi:hypothetical protein
MMMMMMMVLRMERREVWSKSERMDLDFIQEVSLPPSPH